MCVSEPRVNGARSFAVTALWALAAAVLLAASVSAGEAKTSLRDVPEVETPLFAVAVASEVAKTCERLLPRKLRGMRELYRIRSAAHALGYTDAQIRSYIKSDQEKARMRAKGARLLQQAGVTLDEPESFCTYGMAEIEKNSAIGVLLRVK